MKDVIKVNHVSKVYKLYDRPFDRLKEALHPFRKQYHQDFFALQDIDFTIAEGEVVGILGHNGSGKSTLLKMIAGVLTPTAGDIQVLGSVGALLELGAGFNPELTGIENVYFNSAILGFSQNTIEEKLQDILLFADIGDFIHQPIKTYSSGMLMRLAFSVAIHMDPDILIIDEALSVGDMRFQLKCFKKLEEWRKQGKTLLLVSHDVGVMRTMCDRVIWLNKGCLLTEGDPKSVTRSYEAFMYQGLDPRTDKEVASTINVSSSETSSAVQDIQWSFIDKKSVKSGYGGVEILRAALYDVSPYQLATLLEGGESVVFMYEFQAREDIHFPLVSFLLCDQFGKELIGSNNYVLDQHIDPISKGKIVRVSFFFQFPYLHNGKYTFVAGVGDGTQVNHVRHQVVFDAFVVQVAANTLAQAQSTLFKLSDVRLMLD